ncbi:MAG: glycosyltransferase family 4 protein [Acidobacteriota bacterium]
MPREVGAPSQESVRLSVGPAPSLADYRRFHGERKQQDGALSGEDSLRVLVVTHNSQEQARGGTELFTARLVEGLRDRSVDCQLLARDLRPHRGEATGAFRRTGRDELLWAPGAFVEFNLRQASARARREFRDLVHGFRPDVIHFQHYLGLGIDLVVEAKRARPEAIVLLTLHELRLICHDDGHMYKRRSQRLCERSSPSDCHECFPEMSPENFFKRQVFIQGCLRHADLLISPSEFLRQRFIEWGTDANRIRVIDNGQPAALGPVPVDDEAVGTFGFFGQILEKKGLHVLLEAARILVDDGTKGWKIEVNGDSSFATPAYRDSIRRSVVALGARVRDNGAYDPAALVSRMARVGWVVVPSIWWENRPLVIQEAFRCGRPVICSDIGGMAEAVEPGVGGLHFRAGDPYDLADVMRRAAQSPIVWKRLREWLPDVPDVERTTDLHLELYEELTGGARPTPIGARRCAR